MRPRNPTRAAPGDLGTSGLRARGCMRPRNPTRDAPESGFRRGMHRSESPGQSGSGARGCIRPRNPTRAAPRSRDSDSGMHRSESPGESGSGICECIRRRNPTRDAPRSGGWRSSAGSDCGCIRRRPPTRDAPETIDGQRALSGVTGPAADRAVDRMQAVPGVVAGAPGRCSRPRWRRPAGGWCLAAATTPPRGRPARCRSPVPATPRPPSGCTRPPIPRTRGSCRLG